MAAAPPTLEVWKTIITRDDRQVMLSLLARGVRLDRAREICHETWARLYEQYSLGRLDRLALPGIAIVQAAFIAAQDGRRVNAARMHSRLELAPEVKALMDPLSSPEERLASRELLERATQVLEQCSERAQQIFQVVYDNPDTPHAELAKRLGLSVQRLRQTLCEVRGRIRRALVEDSHD
jgi:RNA polymerase sigma-70 factor (ECF subfamily)